jgi:hypothetical protein
LIRATNNSIKSAFGSLLGQKLVAELVAFTTDKMFTDAVKGVDELLRSSGLSATFESDLRPGLAYLESEIRVACVTLADDVLGALDAVGEITTELEGIAKLQASTQNEVAKKREAFVEYLRKRYPELLSECFKRIREMGPRRVAQRIAAYRKSTFGFYSTNSEVVATATQELYSELREKNRYTESHAEVVSRELTSKLAVSRQTEASYGGSNTDELRNKFEKISETLAKFARESRDFETEPSKVLGTAGS